MKGLSISSTPYLIAGVVVVALVLTAHFLIYGIPNNDDSLIHFTFSSGVYDSVMNGHLSVPMQPLVNNGYGAYTVRFYPMLAAYSIAAFYGICRSWQVAGFLFFWFWMSVGGCGVFLFAKEWVANKYAFLAAVLYVCEPYHNVEINALFADAEFVAGSVLVFCFLFTTRAIKHGRTVDCLGLAASYSLLILSNIPITLIGSVLLGIYAAGCFYSFRSDVGKVLRVMGAFIVGAIGSSFYLYRLFSELAWINHSADEYLKVSGKAYDYYFVDNASAFFPGDLVLFNLLFLTAVPIAILLLRAERNIRRTAIPLIAVTLISMFMSTSYSGFTWSAIPVFQKVQFPWRWFTATSIGFAMLAGLATSRLANILPGKKAVMALWVVVLLGSTLLFTFAYVIRPNLMDPSFTIAGSALDDAVKRNSHGPTFDVWQTVWTKTSAFSIPEKVVANGRRSEVEQWAALNKRVKIDPGEAGGVRLAISCYPHWKATVNGVPVIVSRTDDGAVLVPVGPEASVIDLNFAEPLPINVLTMVSVVTWLFLLVAAAVIGVGQLRGAP